MSNISFINDNSLANSFIQELYIGFNWNSPVNVTLSTASYGNANQNFSITISINGGANLSDAFTFEQEYSGNVPPNPIKLESNGIYKGVDCYAVVMWNAISDPSLSDENGMVFFDATVNREAATLLDNSHDIKEFIYYHALDELTHEAVAHCKFIREDVPFPTIMGEPESTDSNSFIQTIIQNNNVVINLTSDIVVYKDNNSLYGQTEYNNQVIKTLINLNNKNLVINGNNHNIYEIGDTIQAIYYSDSNRYEVQFNDDITENDAFITPNGQIIPLTKSKMYQAKGWAREISLDSENYYCYGLQLPDELKDILYTQEDQHTNLFVSYRLSFLRYTKRVTFIDNDYLYFNVGKNDDDLTKDDNLRGICTNPDFFLINYSDNRDDVGALVKGGYISYPECYGDTFSRCSATYLFWINANCNIVFNDITFIGGLEYAVRNDGVLHLNNCHFINQVGGGVLNHFRVIVDRCYFNNIFTIGVRFDHLHGIYSQDPYMEVTNSTFRNIAHYGTNTYAIRSTGKAYIAGNEFVDTNYGAVFTGQVNCPSVEKRHSFGMIERNFIHYTPEWIEERKTFGLQDSGDIYVSVNNIMAIVRFNTIIGTGGLRCGIQNRKNNAIYVDDGAYNVKVYGNVITGTENYYDIDSRDVSNDEYYNRLTPNNHDNDGAVLNNSYTINIDSNNDPNNAYIDLSKNNLIAFNVCDGWVRMQENLTLNETGCRFINNFILDNFRSITQENMANIYNRVDDCLQSEGIIPDEYGMNSCTSLWYLMYMNKKKLL